MYPRLLQATEAVPPFNEQKGDHVPLAQNNRLPSLDTPASSISICPGSQAVSAPGGGIHVSSVIQ